MALGVAGSGSQRGVAVLQSAVVVDREVVKLRAGGLDIAIELERFRSAGVDHAAKRGFGMLGAVADAQALDGHVILRRIVRHDFSLAVLLLQAPDDLCGRNRPR